MVDRSDDASCLLGLAGLAVERVALTALGVRVVQLVTDGPDVGALPGVPGGVDVGQGLGADRPRDLPSGGGQVAVVWRK